MQIVGAISGKKDVKVSHQPFCGAHDIKIKTHFSTISLGTEQATVRNTNLFLAIKRIDKIKILILSLRKNGLKETLRKIKNAKKHFSRIGYSLVGEIVQIGNRVTTPVLKVGDLVVAGGQYACHAEYVSVPQGMVLKLSKNYNKENFHLYSLATIGSISVNAIRHLLDIPKPKQVKDRVCVIVGGGIIGMFCALYLKKLGVKNVLFHDVKKVTLLDAFCERHFYDEYFDHLWVCTDNMNGVDSLLENANFGASISIVGETKLNLDRSILEERYITLRFCKSFGSGRGEVRYEQGLSKNYLGHEYDIRSNIQEACKVISIFERKLNELVSIQKFDNLVIKDKINILDWRK